MPREVYLPAAKCTPLLEDFLDWMALNWDEEVVSILSDDGKFEGFACQTVTSKFAVFKAGWECHAQRNK